MNRYLRYLLFGICAVQLLFAIAFLLQIPFATQLWPLPNTTPMSFIFLSSILAAAFASTLWCLLAQENGALAGIALDYIAIFITLGILALQMAASIGNAMLLFAVACASGVLFGRERNGLETSELANADALVMIPVNTRFASLNLAQAVLIVAYEWMRANEAASLGRVTTYERPISAGLQLGNTRVATKEEMAGFFDHIEAELDRHGYFNPPEKRPTQTRTT